jgi:hypothetical protein
LYSLPLTQQNGISAGIKFLEQLATGFMPKTGILQIHSLMYMLPQIVMLTQEEVEATLPAISLLVGLGE